MLKVYVCIQSCQCLVSGWSKQDNFFRSNRVILYLLELFSRKGQTISVSCFRIFVTFMSSKIFTFFLPEKNITRKKRRSKFEFVCCFSKFKFSFQKYICEFSSIEKNTAVKDNVKIIIIINYVVYVKRLHRTYRTLKRTRVEISTQKFVRRANTDS